MIFDALFLAFSLGSEKGKEQTAAIEAKRMMQDEELQRSRFFENEKRWQRDVFAFGDGLNTMQWNKILELLDLIDDGYFPVCHTGNGSSYQKEIQFYHLGNYELKKIHETPELVRVYMKLTDAKEYFDRGYTCNDWICPDGVFFKQLMLWNSTRELLNNGKVLIGLPFGGGTEPQPMTTKEARDFMRTVMENRFQEWFSRVKG